MQIGWRVVVLATGEVGRIADMNEKGWLYVVLDESGWGDHYHPQELEIRDFHEREAA